MVSWFAGLSAIGMVLTYISTGILRKFLGKQILAHQLTRWLTLFSVALVISLLLFPISSSILLSFLFLLLIGILRALIYPLYSAWVNQNIPSEIRATIISMSSLVDATGQIGGGPILGVIARNYSIQTGLLMSSLFLSPVLFLLMAFFIKQKQKEVLLR